MSFAQQLVDHRLGQLEPHRDGARRPVLRPPMKSNSSTGERDPRIGRGSPRLGGSMKSSVPSWRSGVTNTSTTRPGGDPLENVRQARGSRRHLGRRVDPRRRERGLDPPPLGVRHPSGGRGGDALRVVSTSSVSGPVGPAAHHLAQAQNVIPSP
jgi:hypothetical protein